MEGRRLTTALAGLALLAAACGGGDDVSATTDDAPTDATTAQPVELVLLTHDSFALSEGTLAAFTDETGVSVELLQGGDAGTVLNQAILTKDNPTADVLFGVDNTFLSRALEEDLFVAHTSAALDTVDPALVLDPEHRVTPIDFGDVCINYDIAAFDGTPPPQTIADLADDAYAGQLVVEDPASSSPGLAFLLATIATFGEEGDYTWQDYWNDLVDNDLLVTSGWEEAYYGSFSGGSGEGDRPLVVSYASSPPVEVLFADPPTDEAPTAALTDGCFRQIEFAGILDGTAHEEAAGLLIDFMLSPTFQEDIPLNMFVWPAVTETPLPDVFVEHAELAASPADVEADAIAANRERWIEEWTELQR
jgi:thiamine transport system substrate-binding protein